MRTHYVIDDNIAYKNALSILSNIKISHYKNKTFEEILSDINSLCELIDGAGEITIYLLASKIAELLKIKKTKIILYHYKIIRAIKILNIRNIYKIKINDQYYKYVLIDDIIEQFNKLGINYDNNIINKNANFNNVEKYLYYWQSLY